MKKIRAALAALAAVLVAGTSGGAAAQSRLEGGSTAPQVVTMPAVAPPSAETSLRGSSIYIYTFLDVRQNEFGLKVVNQVDQQLVERFADEDVDAKVLRFRNSTIGQNYLLGSGFAGSSASVIPVEQVMAANTEDEQAVGARYRLVVFPANYEITGAWQYYEIRWVLYDIQSGRRVWSYLYSGRHLMMWSAGENSVKRAKKFIDKAMTALKGAGYL